MRAYYIELCEVVGANDYRGVAESIGLAEAAHTLG